VSSVQEEKFDDTKLPGSDGEAKCVYYPTMSCPVMERLESVSLSDRIELNIKNDSPIRPVQFIPTNLQRFMVLSAFCAMCPYKASIDAEDQIKWRMEMSERYGPERDGELHIVRVLDPRGDRPSIIRVGKRSE